MKIFLIILIVIVLVIVIAVGVFWFLSTQPLYNPGMVSRGKGLSAPLEPPSQLSGSSTWLVEDGIELFHFNEGEGRDVLIVHGGPGMPFSSPIAGLQPLTDEYRFHYYDQRGCGQSTRPIDRFSSSNTYENMSELDRTLGIGAQIADIERIRRILNQDRLILIGHSWGGFLASLYAAEFPDRVETLILVAPANVLIMPQPDADSDLFASVRSRLDEDEQVEFDAFMGDYMDFKTLYNLSEQDLVKKQLDFGEYYAKVLGVTADFPDQGDPGGWMVWAQYVSMGQRHDYSTSLAVVDVPVLVIHGGGDLQSEKASRLYADSFPNASFEVISGADHFSFEQQPDAFADIVRSFLYGEN